MTEKAHIEPLGKDTQFSADNQPSAQAKSSGTKAWWDRRKFKDELFQEFAKPLLGKDGIEKATFEEGVKLLKKVIFYPSEDLSDKDRAELFLKLSLALAPQENKIEASITGDVEHNVSGIDKFAVILQKHQINNVEQPGVG